jgi:hypothetical protein
MSALFYERSGGFVGLIQSLKVEGNSLRASDKGKLVSERELSLDEVRQFEDLLDKIDGAPPAQDNSEASGTPDSYMVTLSIEGEPEPRANVTTLTLPVIGSGEVWDEVLGWFDRLLTHELRAAQKSGPQILSADEMRGEY